MLNAEVRRKQLFLPPRQRREKIRGGRPGGGHPFRAEGYGGRYPALSRRPGLTMQFSSLRVWRHSRQLPTEKANKIIIPSDIQGIAGLVKSIAEVASKDEAAE